MTNGTRRYERSAFNDYIEKLDRKLDAIKRILDDTRQVDEALHDRLSIRFEQLIASQRAGIVDLRQKVGDPRVSAARRWAELSEADKNCQELSQDVLTFLGGLLVRRFGFDGGICVIADTLCWHWSDAAQVGHGLLTIPAESDSYRDVTHIIRVRFPDFSVWSLPIVAHEFGHYLQATKRHQYFLNLYGDILLDEGIRWHDEAGLEEAILQHGDLEEQMADLFAVYALGPAYACTCILGEFYPGVSDGLIRQGDKVYITHPSAAKRAHFILNALEKMQDHDVTKPYRPLARQLGQTWSARLEAAGEELTYDQVAALDRRLEKMYRLLSNPANQIAGVRYTTDRWSRVQMLGTHLESRTADGLGSAELEQLVSGNDIVLMDVLNAAWYCRLRNPHLKPDHISQRALELCRSILSQKS